MKNIARLVLFFSLCFIIVFAVAGVLNYLQLSADAARTIPAGPPVKLAEFIATLRNIFPLLLYIIILMTLSYTVRRDIPLGVTLIGLFILAGGITLGLSLGLDTLESTGIGPGGLFPPSRPGAPAKTMGAPGLILSQGDTVMVVLGDPGKSGSSRVVSIPGRPLIYQEVPSGPNNTILALPPAPFRNENSYLMSGILVDSTLVAKQFSSRLKQGLFPFALYGAALIFLLISLRFVLDLSSWPLANLFSGALVFRGILAFQTFIDASAIQEFILKFFDNRIEAFFISPVIFTGIGIIVLIYTLLVSFVRSQGKPKGRILRNSRKKRRREVRQ
ncbi:putative membrane protein [Treponema primitia ZAS-2]|uniref:Putative membrane protein n=1 Tax=Treponema primitia (strain ATCC BAA-887 / DSM 12427 / ZAS-2) TaxID=545694 RepID=F5YNC3_TREPZ|nr:hypothetical protein [Treponema primitia]AEF84167.1 putative membrane protein [Treponema primitia ZAS-2]